ncbi:MAG: hypothetical protein HGA45_18550 [Chloroflexales bacterium]|nr:hypothetical protein [Chloroflexales bacterium]
MKNFLNNTILGALEIIETYEHYDRPVLFSCRNQVGSLFLVVLTGDDEEGEEWLIAPVSHRRFEYIRSGGIDLHTAFAKVEGENLILLYIPLDNSTEIKIDFVKAISIDPYKLPQEGERLDIPTVTMQSVFESPSKRANQMRRESVDISLETITPERNEIPVGRLGSVISNFQRLLNAIGNKIFGTGSIKGAFSQDTVIDMQLNVVGFSPGSFRVNMASSATANLFDDTKIGDALNEMLNLIRIAEDDRVLQSRLMDLGSRVSSSFVEFLESVNLDVTDIKIEWGSPHPGKGGVAAISSLTAQKTARSIRSFEEQAFREFTITAKLIGANLRTMKFEIEMDDSSIAGDIDSDAKNLVDGAVIGQSYVIRIKEVEIFRPMIEESSLKYYLMSLDAMK